MKSSPRRFASLAAFAALTATPALRAQAPAAASPAAPSPAPLTNAALAMYGTHISYKPGGPDVKKNAETTTEALQDGNPHSRLVVTGAPYTLEVRLPVALPIDKISFSQDDSPTESAPTELEISFDGGQPIKKTLDPAHVEKPAKGPTVPAWQDVPVGKEIKSVRVTVLAVSAGSVNYGGLGDIALWTSANVIDKIRGGAPGGPATAAVPAPAKGKGRGKNKSAGDEPLIPPPGYDSAVATFVHSTARTTGDAAQKAVLPPVALPGEHPRLMFTPKELAEFKNTLNTTERGKAALESFMGVANAAVANPPAFPSPEDTAANKSEAGKVHFANSHHAQECGFAYALSGDEKFAKQARDILVGYSERYASYPQHSGRNRADNSKITFQRLSEAMWVMPLLEGYDYIYHSKSLSDADRKLIEDGLIRQAILEIRRKDPKAEAAQEDKKNPAWRTTTPENAKEGKFPNWVNFYNSATMMAGSLLGDKDMVDLAAAGFREAVAKGIGEDGMWGEGAIGYQMFALGAMCPGFEAAARQGVNLWDTSNGRIKNLFDSPLYYAYPDGSMPGIGDSGRAKLSGWDTMVYDYGYSRFKDPRYAYIVNAAPRQLHTSDDVYEPTRVYEKLPEVESIKAGSVLFGSLGYSILRDDTKYALMHSGPFVAPHSHYDKLNLVLFASPAPGKEGDEMGGEPQFHFYDNALHPEWVRQSIAHNTMTVDEHSQAASAGKLLLYEVTPDIKLMRAEAANCYPNVMLDRTVVMLPGAVVDLFHGLSTTPHTWDRTLRYNGALDGLPATVPPDAKKLGDGDGYEHIKVSKEQSATDTWTGTWQTKVGAFTATLAGAPGQKVFYGTGPDKDQIAVARQEGVGADFAAVYGMPAWKDGVASAKWLPADPAMNGARAFELKQQDGGTVLVVAAYNPGEWQAAGWKSDARVLVVCTKGDSVKVLVGGGKFAQNGALEVRQDTAGNLLAQKQGGKLGVVSQWTPPATDADAPAKVAAADTGR